jgi:hypothetical protein
MTTLNPEHLHDKATLFLDQIALSANNDEVLEKVKQFFGGSVVNRHILFKSASLHYVENTGAVLGVDSVSSNFSGDYYLRFDGLRVSRIEPDYYLGTADKRGGDRWSDGGFEFGSDVSSNNNNNNNNNNGNNNG